MSPLDRALKTLIIRLAVLRVAFPDMPLRERPGFAWRLLTAGPSLDHALSFLASFKERHFSPGPALQQEVWAYVLLATHDWERIRMTLFLDYMPIYTATVDAPDREHLRSGIEENLTQVPPHVREVVVGLTSLASQG
jgi:hypothetical protein